MYLFRLFLDAIVPSTAEIARDYLMVWLIPAVLVVLAAAVVVLLLIRRRKKQQKEGKK